jgi:DNA modification methylase
MKEYQEFLKLKRIVAQANGIEISKKSLNPILFEFQKDLVFWALKKGRAAIFAGTGLGKTLMQCEWAKFIPGRVLILAPLAVSQQTIYEAKKIGLAVHLCSSQADVQPGINITNYEKLHKFEAKAFTGVVLDESSILKAMDGKTRNLLIEMFSKTPYRLACTATPAPNDFMELGNHCQFLGVMNYNEMLAVFFIHDGGDTAKWRLKGHAENKFWEWMSSWAAVVSKPSDLGYEDGDFELPELRIHEHIIKNNKPSKGRLLTLEARTLEEQRIAKKETVNERVDKCAELVNSTKDAFLVWCSLNIESELLSKAIPNSVEVKGSDSSEYKEKAMLDFANGKIRVLISKPSICGFGMNFQICSNMAFVGISHSFEQYYQAVRRCWRFGQFHPVDVHLIISELEGAVKTNLERKEKEAEKMTQEMINHTKEIIRQNIKATERQTDIYQADKKMIIPEWLQKEKEEEKEKEITINTSIKTQKITNDYAIYLGDSCEAVKALPDESIGLHIYSPPFSNIYVYSNSERDLGNSKNDDEFFQHFSFLAQDLYRILQSGRIMAVHCWDQPMLKQRDGIIGYKDLPGQLIKLFENVGFVYHSRITIRKCPVVEVTRTKALGLLHKQLCKDSAMSRVANPDYLVVMRKPGENKKPITHNKEDFPVLIWRKWAETIWGDINQSRTLQKGLAKEEQDEKHIAPLQLDVIERAICLWSNPGDIVFSPFMGIGSEVHQAVKFGRKGVGIELKESYYIQAVKNLKNLTKKQPQLL